MSVEAGRPPFRRSVSSLAMRVQKQGLRRKWNGRKRIRHSTILGIFACFYGALVLQQFHWLWILVTENSGQNRILLAPALETTEQFSRISERNDFVITHSDLKTRDENNFNLHRQFREIQGNAVLVFRFPNHSGQGIGNIMSGALAAQLLAEEFNRTLCHAGEESTNVHASFRKAFQWVDQRHQDFCDRILLNAGEKMMNLMPNASNTIVQRNYDTTSEQSECAMRELLSNHAEFPIVFYEGNTYPRWPSKVVSSPRDHFHEKYKATERLRQVLPWKEDSPPPVIVHLRDGDDERDQRGGVDDQTLSLLATNNFLQNPNPQEQQIFLVTNNVQWYSRFPEWSHPNWSLVHHSALKRISWGERQNGIEGDSRHESKDDGELQMWSDWYTLLNAREIYHTFSDFSRSASRWNENIKSWTILGSTEEKGNGEERKDGKHILLRNDNEYSPELSKYGISRLVDRTTQELWFCGNPSPEEQKHIKEKKDRQLLSQLRARKRREAYMMQNS